MNSSPLPSLIAGQRERIEAWLLEQQTCPPPLYSSMDIRDANRKVAVVDTNLFPAGFNNIHEDFFPGCVQAIRTVLASLGHGDARRVLIVPENHSRNLHYLENLFVLRLLLEQAGLEARIGIPDSDTDGSAARQTANGHSVHLQPMAREQDLLRLTDEDFVADFVILNNDLSSGVPEHLQGLRQTVLPAPQLGWANRLKSRHFSCYQKVSEEFAALLDMDPWLIAPMFRNCGEVDFMRNEGSDCLSSQADTLLRAIRGKYDEYDVEDPPFVVIKADSGTYGMGIMMVHDAKELDSLNRKQRTRMSKTKEGQAIRKVILQEGVYTHETRHSPAAISEPVLYGIGNEVVGGFYRVHEQRGRNENLNSPGMRFEPLDMQDSQTDQFYMYTVVARLAMLAAAKENM